MSDNPTGPELFAAVGGKMADAQMETPGSPLELSDLVTAQLMATQANTAALVMFAGLYANAHGIRDRELEVWSEVIPAPPLVECWGMEARRPECAERHTEDCAYTDPVPEPKHELLPVGTRVLVSERKYADEDYPEQPYVGRIAGYDMYRSKYQINPESYGEPGVYRDYVKWAFADNRVERHPEQNPTPPASEPKPPQVYVQNRRGKTGHIVAFGEDDLHEVKVQWHSMGAEPVWYPIADLEFILPSQVDRCPNGQTGDECGSGENRCELCLREDERAGL